MENKKVGWLIIGIGIAMIAIVLIFNFSLKGIVDTTCDHGNECTMYNTMNTQLLLSITIVLVIFAIGLYIMFSKPEERTIEKTIIKKVKEKKKKLDLTGLNQNEKKVIELLQKDKAIFQADLKEKLEIGKVGLTRLLDKLEAKQFIERKRRGMNNIVVLRD
ncbi:MarR family transcriptional regulator [archaeon]|jgi:uncharacterized membrane protein|nr:MarR family transcriptional regulator [archaeon]